MTPLEPQDVSDLCAGFQAAVLESTADRLSVGLRLFHEQFGPPRALVAAGGVAANQAIRGALQDVAAKAQTTLIIPPPALCTDNGAMIAWAGAERLALGLTDTMDARAARALAARCQRAQRRPATANHPRGILDEDRDAVFNSRRGDRRRRMGHGAGGVAARGPAAMSCSTRATPRAAAQIASDAQQSATARRARSTSASRSPPTIAEAARADIILMATPAQHLREAVVSARAAPAQGHARHRLRQGHRARHAQIHDRSDRGSRAAMRCPAILSGPSFADDVARGLPTAVTLAAKDETLASALVQALGSSTFRPYHTTMSAASRSAARPRTCWRSPPASSPAASSARRRWRR